MKKLKINQNNSLKRVLSVDEMKSIFGGMGASITCTCTMTIIKTIEGIPTSTTEEREPTGEFYTEELCQTACEATCANLGEKVCSNPKGNFSYSFEGGSGSESGSEYGSGYGS